MLEELSKKHSKWINMAYKICKCKDYSKDIVQDMYVKMYDMYQKNPKLEARDVYVWVVILNIIIDDKKAKIDKIPLEDIFNLQIEDNNNGFDDTDVLFISRANEFRYLHRGLLEQTYDKGLRQIEKETGINYMFIHRLLTKTRKLILREDYNKLYDNKRLKYKK